MSERLMRSPITPPPPDAQEAMRRLGCRFEEREEGLLIVYPEGASRETVDERVGRYTVFIVQHYQPRQIVELYNYLTRHWIIILKPFQFR
jgi:hypothetical protein